MKRIVLFLVTNLAVLLVLSSVVQVLGVDRFLSARGLDLPVLLAFSAVIGFGGSIVSLLISKTVAKWSTGARVITLPANASERWLVQAVSALSRRAGVRMPEVAIYEGAPNAFATGAFRNSALVAVSSGLLESMNHEEIEAVLAHEIAHIANGDMVTLTLIQGVVNTFVVFLARVVGYFVDQSLSRGDKGSPGMGYYLTVVVCEIIFGIAATLIVMAFSRRREFRADFGATGYIGSARPMIAALRRLGGLDPGELPVSLRAMGINSPPGWTALFSSHPPLEQRIAALHELEQ